MAKVGDKIKIIYMEGEPQYSGKVGVITRTYSDPWGDWRLEGTWGGCAIYPDKDEFEVIEEATK